MLSLSLSLALTFALSLSLTLALLLSRSLSLSLSLALALSRSLRRYIQSCHIGNKAGSVAIGDALASNNGIKELYVYGNGIADDGAMEIARGLKRNTVHALM